MNGLSFLFGIVLGVILGIILMCILIAGRDEDNEK